MQFWQLKCPPFAIFYLEAEERSVNYLLESLINVILKETINNKENELFKIT